MGVPREKTTEDHYFGSSQITWINECIEQGTMICALLVAMKRSDVAGAGGGFWECLF